MNEDDAVTDASASPSDGADSARQTETEQLAQALRARVRSVQLATVSTEGEPHIGYTPFVFEGRDLLVFVSELAVHTRDLLATARASAMLIDDESASKELFARTRLTYQCEAVHIERGHEDRDLLLDLYEARHGKMVQLLRQLPDFHLFRLVPTSGMFVVGFGKAYHLSGDALDHFDHARRA